MSHTFAVSVIACYFGKKLDSLLKIKMVAFPEPLQFFCILFDKTFQM